MSKVTVYRFRDYDIATDEMKISRRWGTREAIQSIGAEVLEETCTEVNESVLKSDIAGFTDRGFDPHASAPGFQTQVR
jgi:hypothetical protein